MKQRYRVPDKKKKFFVKLCIDLAEKLKIKWNDVLKAFFGNKQNQLLSLKQQLNKLRIKEV